ncbi:S41 family peptidase [Mycoplasma simbae]|uniref:S41 family peptidase n=1 Tax=Mycoplasma simbae TaxID=36744 RepID=UPI0004971C86|nr:S41 family peptidase [Mycoplasma simbae]
MSKKILKIFNKILFGSSVLATLSTTSCVNACDKNNDRTDTKKIPDPADTPGAIKQTKENIKEPNKGEEIKWVDQTLKNTLLNLGQKQYKTITSSVKTAAEAVNLYKHLKNEQIYINVAEAMAKFKNTAISDKVKSITHNDTVITYELENNNILSFDEKLDSIKFTSISNFGWNGNKRELPKPSRMLFDKYFLHSFDNWKPKTLNLKDYSIDIIIDNGNVFLPLSTFNLIFTANVLYNADVLFSADYNASRIELDKLEPFYENTRFSVESNAQRIENYNHLALMMDKFYGPAKLMYARNNVNNFYELIQKANLQNYILSTDPSVYAEAYRKLWYVYLNDLHAYVATHSLYRKDNPIANLEGIKYSTKANKYIATKTKLTKLRDSITFTNGSSYNDTMLNIVGDTARIIVDGFISDSVNGVERNNWWKRDTYWLFKDAMDLIKADKNVKKIIVDISLNSGGVTDAMQEAAGFIADKDVNVYVANTLSQEYLDLNFKVDTNDDKKFDAKDISPNYEWYVLTGANTFSAANLFAHWAKSYGKAKIIGNKSSGGMYSIAGTVLPDGTQVDISSFNAWTAAPKITPSSFNDLPNTEEGIEVDFTLNYDDYYKDNILELMQAVN